MIAQERISATELWPICFTFKWVNKSNEDRLFYIRDFIFFLSISKQILKPDSPIRVTVMSLKAKCKKIVNQNLGESIHFQ